jgi:hypothetical protein
MVYNIGDYREFINNYFFENDEFGNIYVYQKGTMKYLDMIDINYKYVYDEFIIQCNNWINKKQL